ncbi:MAG: ATP-binding cassette domain-containing protein [Actinobacteria bacterium]|nr:ATP-binding cassette domain-containing protein [Actinomycetota bacterium]
MTDRATGGNGRPLIRLENLTKRFPGQKQNAIDELSLEIPEGEIVILVGPSGSGKTTTLRMINRLIEPTSGRIFLEDEDVTKVNRDKLRRRMGYVIQQTGLFPHMTIADNIATVPRLLGWSRQKIRDRVHELIEMVGMDPEIYAQRYPKELSGGQSQRVGVARAMAADPPVILMDEPFSAIDPITRARLQNEFLQLQTKIRKTIVFVTHDIDEAIKMGDRIAILDEHSHIAQYDTPRTILAAPATAFVEAFIGAGSSLKRLNLTHVREVELVDFPTAHVSADRESVRETLLRSDKGSVLLLDDDRRPLRWVNAIDLEHAHIPLAEAGLPATPALQEQATLYDALNEMLTSLQGSSAVVGEDGVYRGVIEIETIVAAIRSMRADARQRYRGEEGEDPAGDAEQSELVS